MSFKCSFSPLSKNFRITALAVLLCTIVVVDGYAQFMYSLDNDTLLKPDTNNVVRTAYPDSIVYSYYFDNAHSKLRSKYMYSIDPRDRREVIFIQTYCFCGQRASAETFKNYNRRLKTMDKNFTISKSVIAKDAEELKPIITQYSDQVKYYTQVGAELGWFCSGNRHDSTWHYPTKKFLTYRGTEHGEKYRFRLNDTEQRGIGYGWYESGNVEEEWFYKNGEDTAYFFYYDDSTHTVSSKTIYLKDKNAKGATYLWCLYYPNGAIQDSFIFDSKTRDELEQYHYYKNGLTKSIYIDRPGFKNDESYDSTGRPKQIERKVLYKGKWYACKQLHYANGQLASSYQSQQFYVLHPEYGSLPDSILYIDEEYQTDGIRILYKYMNKNGITYSFVYRENGTLEKKVMFNREGIGTETEYDENGAFINQKNINLNKK
jgi:hypothetical protein